MLMTGDNPFQATESAATFKSGEKPKFLHVADPETQSGPMIMGKGENPFQSTGSEATFKSGEKAPKFLYTADDPQPGGTHLRQQQLEEDIPRRKRVGDNPGDWSCNQCDKQNFSRETECFRCKHPKGAPKTEEAPKKTKQDDPEDDEWKSIPGGRRGDWLCKKCGKHNFSKNKFNCFFCKTPRNPEKAEKDKSNEPIVPGSYRDYLRRKELGELDQEPPPWDSSGVADPTEVPEVVNDEVPPTPAQQADDDDYYDDAPDMGKY